MEKLSHVRKAIVGFLLILTLIQSAQSFKSLEDKDVPTRNLPLAQDQKQSSQSVQTQDLNQQRTMIDKNRAVSLNDPLKSDRQPRTFSDDLLSGMLGNRRGTKKMSINGFIPIVKVDSSKEENQDDQEQEDETAQQEQQSTSNLLANLGQPSGTGNTNFPQQQQFQYQDESQDTDRKGKRFPGGELLSALMGQNFNHQHLGLSSQLVGQAQRPTLQPASMGECVCVPFFQCKDGYLSESQLRKGQLQMQQSFRPYPFKVPRALGQQKENLMVQDQPLISENPLNTPPEYQTMSDELIYEQLRKTIENENLEQAANNQLFDERSVKGANQNISEKSLIESDLYERSILNPLVGLHRPAQHRSCGIMRTCCKVPPRQSFPTMGHTFTNNQYQHQAYHHRFNEPQISQSIFPQQRPFTYPHASHPNNLQHHIHHHNQMSGAHLAQASSQINYQQPANSLLSINQFQRQQRPPGEFMAGKCGLKQTIGVSGRVQNHQPVPGSESTAEFGEFPAHVAILKRLPSGSGDSLFLCSGVLISNKWLATAAHCVRRLRAEELKVRLGEWDVGRDDEFYPFVESNIRDIVIHPDFQPSSLINDLALLRMDITIDPQQMPHITPACLAVPGETFNQQRCWLTGWGKDAFGQVGSFQSVLKKVDLPIMGRHECEAALRYQTKLGQFFRLHQSAMCAGGERGKDACEGDGGAGLYCTDTTTGLTKVAGLVSWGIGCGQVGVPGVYTNLAHFYHWIEQVAAASGDESLYMDKNGGSSSDGSIMNIINERTIASASNSTQQTNLSSASSNGTQLFDSNQQEAAESELESRAG